MTSAEITEWMAFDAIEPFGERRADLRNAMLVAAVINHSMSPPKEPARVQDFMLDFGERKADDGPTLLRDPKAQAALIKQLLLRHQG